MDAKKRKIKTPNPVFEQEIIQKHKNMVKSIAYHFLGRLPRGVLLEDLIQVGLIGLMEASRNYDPSHGVSFENFAGIRVRGSMLDEVRRTQWSSRAHHQKMRRITNAITVLETRHSRHPTGKEIAEHLDMSLKEYHQTLQSAKNLQIVSLENGLSDEQTSLAESIPSPTDTPEEVFNAQVTKKQIAVALESLSEREKKIMSLYYEVELNLKEIGKILGVSESRVCQLRGQALLRVCAKLSELQ